MQEKQYTPSLLSFFIYNPTFGPREGEVSLIPREARLFTTESVFVYLCFFLGKLFSSANARCLCLFQEEKKILFYHPSDVEKNEKIRNVGLCEAIVQFTR